MRKPRAAPVLPPAERRLIVGVIGAAHGVRGECRVKSFTADPLALGDYGPLFLADGRTLEIIEGRPVKDDMLVVRFAGLADREAVRSLTGQNLIVDRANLPETEDEDEFYHADLIGLRAEDAAGTVHGTIVEIHNHGAGDLLLIALNGTRATALLPFTREAVPKVDMKARCILIEPGFLAGPEQPPAEPAPSSPHDP